ncbi:MAG: hypothetical protein ACXV45_08010, partial [Halobacteriota archaeon]
LRRRSISRLLNTGFLHRSIKGIVWAIINTLSARSHQGIVTRCTAVRTEGQRLLRGVTTMDRMGEKKAAALVAPSNALNVTTKHPRGARAASEF